MVIDAHDFVLMYIDIESRDSIDTLVGILRDFLGQALAGEVRISEPLDVEEIASALARLVGTGEVPLNDMQELASQFARFVEGLAIAQQVPFEYLHAAVDKVRAGFRGLPRSVVDELTTYNIGRRLTQAVMYPYAGGHERLEAARQAENEGVLERLAGRALPQTAPVVFFLGAGASKPAPSDIPTVNELLGQLWSKSDRMQPKPLEKLKAWCRENSIDNIEEMLTAVTISRLIIQSPKVHGLLNSVLYPEWKRLRDISVRGVDAVLLLEKEVNSFFSLMMGTMLNARPNAIHSAIAGCAKEREAVHILTTNYDTCIEQALNAVNVPYNYGLETSEPSEAVALVKMHGSINWYYCEACQGVFLPAAEAVLHALEQGVPYAVTGMCPHCSGATTQLIVPPIAHKYITHPPILQVWERGRHILELADVVVVVGYSFAAADDYIGRMLVRAFAHDGEKALLCVDVADRAISRCRALLEAHVPGFDSQRRFFPLHGDGSTLVADVIGSMKASVSHGV